jgi:quinohemoprotein ethanol dehydrogenase
MRRGIVAAVLTVGVVTSAVAMVAQSQGDGRQSGRADWPLHNLDIRNTRFSPLDEINPQNVDRLALAWSYQATGRENIAQVTPLVVDGVMYLHSGSKLVALDAATGQSVWTFEAEQPFIGGGRGPAYGDGRIYAYGQSTLYAVDAKTGKPVPTFGEKGFLPITNKALEFKYGGKYPTHLDPTRLGYSMSSPPTYFAGTLYVTLPFSDSLIPGGLVAAVDGTSGAIKWVFNTIPQGPQDDGWEIAKDTWSEPERYGGGVWTVPAIDPELGMIYFNAGNPAPDYDGSSRKGVNLFTNSLLALNLQTGKLAWHFQAIHHDIWDWDLPAGPVLFDVPMAGRTVKGVGVAGKNCHAYLLNRETGQPLNPVVEMAVPLSSDIPNEQVWPTQPFQYQSNGQPQLPFCSTFPIVQDQELAKRVRPHYHPYQSQEFVITAPGNIGGANYGSPSFSPRTGLFYITGKNEPWSIKVKPVGNSMKPGPGNQGHFGLIGERAETGVTPTATLTAYEPATGRQVWYTEITGATNAGNLVTAGDLIFQGIGNGDFVAVDARSGKQLFKYAGKRGIRASPLTYQARGKQYVSVVATNTVLTFAMP